MADNDQRCLARRKFGFGPLDREQIKVVRRLVKQQDIGRRREYAGKRGAACLTAGQHCRVPVAAEAELFQEIVRGVAVVGRAEARLDIIDDTVKACEIGFLRQVTDGRAGLNEARPVIRLHEPAAILSRLDLPEPLRPTTHTRSPGPTLRSTPSITGEHFLEHV